MKKDSPTVQLLWQKLMKADFSPSAWDLVGSCYWIMCKHTSLSYFGTEYSLEALYLNY